MLSTVIANRMSSPLRAIALATSTSNLSKDSLQSLAADETISVKESGRDLPEVAARFGPRVANLQVAPLQHRKQEISPLLKHLPTVTLDGILHSSWKWRGDCMKR